MEFIVEMILRLLENRMVRTVAITGGLFAITYIVGYLFVMLLAFISMFFHG